MLVSVVIPVFNIEKEYLRRCVESACNQSYVNCEILLIDDGSTDGTGDYCEELAKADERIKVFHKTNGGSSSARNLGIENAKGEFIAFVDSDDYIDSDFISLGIEAINKYQVKMVQLSRDEIDADGNKLPDVCIPPEREKVISSKEQMKELLMHRGDCSFCTRISHKSFFDNRRFPEGKLNEDFFLLTQMLADIDEYVILPNQAYHVFYRIGSNTRKKNPGDFSRVFIDIVDNADYVEELVKNEYPELQEVAKRFALFQRLDYMLHIPIEMMNRENSFYLSVVKYLRINFFKMLTNTYLSGKNKIYLFLLTLCPKTTRKIHRGIKTINER